MSVTISGTTGIDAGSLPVANTGKISAGAGLSAILNTAVVDRVTVDTAGNVGIGVIPSAWQSGIKVLDIGNACIQYGGGTNFEIGVNYYANIGYKYKSTGYASKYYQQDGQHWWYTAPSGTAGNAVTWTQAMTIENNTHTTIGSPVTSYTTGAQLRVEQAANNDTSTASIVISRYSDNYSSALWHCYNAPYNQEAFNLSVSPAGGGSSLTTSYKKYMALGNGNHFWYGATTSNQTMALDSSGYLYFGGDIADATTTGIRRGSAGQLILRASSGGLYQQANTSYYLVTTAGGSTSDITLKKDIELIPNSLNKILNLKGVYYEFIEEQLCTADKGKQIGVIAQDVEQEFPEIVLTNEDGVKTVRYDRLIAPMIEAIKEQNEIIKDLKSRIEILESK